MTCVKVIRILRFATSLCWAFPHHLTPWPQPKSCCKVYIYRISWHTMTATAMNTYRYSFWLGGWLNVVASCSMVIVVVTVSNCCYYIKPSNSINPKSQWLRLCFSTRLCYTLSAGVRVHVSHRSYWLVRIYQRATERAAVNSVHSHRCPCCAALPFVSFHACTMSFLPRNGRPANSSRNCLRAMAWSAIQTHGLWICIHLSSENIRRGCLAELCSLCYGIIPEIEANRNRENGASRLTLATYGYKLIARTYQPNAESTAQFNFTANQITTTREWKTTICANERKKCPGRLLPDFELNDKLLMQSKPDTD